MQSKIWGRQSLKAAKVESHEDDLGLGRLEGGNGWKGGAVESWMRLGKGEGGGARKSGKEKRGRNLKPKTGERDLASQLGRKETEMRWGKGRS